jgi:hypothetical protein
VASERSIDDAVEDLTRIVATARDSRSALGVFPAMYRTVTSTVGEGIEAGVFDHPERVEQLVTVFADLYIDAYHAHAAGREAPRAWDLAFAFADAGRGSICQHLLLGMNAHINLDLGIATAEVCTVDDHPALHADYQRVNDVLFALVDQLQAAMGSVSPWMARLDRIGLGFDEGAMRAGISSARDQAWAFSEQLLAVEADERVALVAERDVETRRLGSLLCARWSMLHHANKVVAWRECRDRTQVIDALGAARIDVRALLATGS